MTNAKILLIDNIPNITLVQESIEPLSLGINIQCVTSVEEAESAIKTNMPDVIMAGSSLIIQDGFEAFLTLGNIPIVILCESYGLNRFIKDRTCNVCFITRPFDLEGIPDMISKAVEFMISCRER